MRRQRQEGNPSSPRVAAPGATPTTVPPPLRLPTGTVRAIIALILCGTLWYWTLRRTVDPPPVLVNSALLVVAFYFGVRSTPPATPGPSGGSLEAPAKTRHPLFLPRGSIRTVLALGFLGVMAYVAYRDGTIPQTLLLVFEIIASYVIGYVFSVILLRRARAGKGLSRRASAVRNVISLVAIGITAGVCWAIVAERFDLVPDVLENGLAWTVAFYFGSRLLA